MLTSSALAAAERSAEQLTEYLLNDDFTDTLTFGAVNGRSAEPGPGRRTVIDSGSKLSISGGQVVVNASAPSSGDPMILYPAVRRTGGRVVIAEVIGSGATAPLRVGFNNSGFTGASYSAIFFNSSGAISGTIAGVAIAGLGSWSTLTTYQVAVVMRSIAGIMIFIKGGAFVNWTLLLVSDLTAGAVWYPCIAAVASGSGFTCNYVRMPATPWLPTPLVSDGFSVWGSSDGRGHAEGVAGIYGSGGNGKAWSSAVGTWGASGGVAAASALSAGRAIATVDCGTADLIIYANMVVPTATLAIVVRWTDESNFIMLRRTPTNLQLVKVVAGVTTTVSDNASTYVAGAEVRLVCEGTKFRMFYNNVAVSTEQTIADAALQTATVVGLRSGDTTCTADNFVVYPRGSRGEHIALGTNFLFIGDSKTTATYLWPQLLLAGLLPGIIGETTPRAAQGGYQLFDMYAEIDTRLAAMTTQADYVLINFGANDASHTPINGTNWKTWLTYMLDAIRTKWPNTKIYIARAWRRGSQLQSDMNYIAKWIREVVATYATGVYFGPDERVTIENGDNGVTYTSDGVHYNAVGAAVWAARHQAVMFGAPYSGPAWQHNGTWEISTTDFLLFNEPTLGSDLLSNGTFETNTTGWTPANAATLTTVTDNRTGSAGTKALDVARTTSSAPYALASVSATAGAWYCYTGWVKKSTADTVRLLLYNNSLSSLLSSSPQVNTDWTRYQITGISPDTTIKPGVQAVSAGASGTGGRFDDLTLQLITLSTLFCVQSGSANPNGVAATGYIVPGTQCGVVYGLDSIASPTGCIAAVHDGVSTVSLLKLVSGVWATVLTVTGVTYANNQLPSIVRASANTYQLWYNGSQRGANQTISDAGSGSLHGVLSTHIGNVVKSFTIS